VLPSALLSMCSFWRLLCFEWSSFKTTVFLLFVEQETATHKKETATTHMVAKCNYNASQGGCPNDVFVTEGGVPRKKCRDHLDKDKANKKKNAVAKAVFSERKAKRAREEAAAEIKREQLKKRKTEDQAKVERFEQLVRDQDTDVNAMFELGESFRVGRGTRKSRSSALECLGKAAALGHVGAMYQLGRCLVFGPRTLEEKQSGFGWIQKAAFRKHVGAMYMAGYCFQKALGTAKDVIFASLWYQRAGSKGHVKAMYRAGCCFAQRSDSRDDQFLAFTWWGRAAKKGHAESMFQVAWCFFHGIPAGLLKVDRPYALSVFKSAASRGHERAQEVVADWANVDGCDESADDDE
jgi:TPR repeat protein